MNQTTDKKLKIIKQKDWNPQTFKLAEKEQIKDYFKNVYINGRNI